jgi:hypothetical protein
MSQNNYSLMLRIAELAVTALDCVYNTMQESVATQRLFRIHATEYGRIRQELRTKVLGQSLEFYHELYLMDFISRLDQLLQPNNVYFGITHFDIIKGCPEYGLRAEIIFQPTSSGTRTASEIWKNTYSDSHDLSDAIQTNVASDRIAQYRNECVKAKTIVPCCRKAIGEFYTLAKTQTDAHPNPFFKPTANHVSPEQGIQWLNWFLDFASEFLRFFELSLPAKQQPTNRRYRTTSIIGLVNADTNTLQFFETVKARFGIQKPVWVCLIDAPAHYSAAFHPLYNLTGSGVSERAFLERCRQYTDSEAAVPDIDAYFEGQRQLKGDNGEYLGGVVVLNISISEDGMVSSAREGLDRDVVLRGYIVHEITHASQYELWYPRYYHHLNSVFNTKNGSGAEIKNKPELDALGQQICDDFVYLYDPNEAEAYRNEYAFIMSSIKDESISFRERIKRYFTEGLGLAYSTLTDFIE